MNATDFDLARLDVAAFAKAAGRLDGRWPLRSLERLHELRVEAPPDGQADAVAWSVRGEKRVERDGDAQIWLHVEAAATMHLECQRCLAPVVVPLVVARSFRFVHGEAAAAQLDAASDDDVLALTRALDLRELIEDELLLGLPIVPRHDVCPIPLTAPADPLVDEPEPNPFAALAGYKRARTPS